MIGINWKDPYTEINIILAGVICLVFIYSGIFSPDSNSYPIECSHQILYGKACASCGFSHAFSAFVRFDFEKGNNFNPYAFSAFLFFLIQFLLRISIPFFTQKIKHQKLIIIFDAALSILMFLYFFRVFVFFRY